MFLHFACIILLINILPANSGKLASNRKLQLPIIHYLMHLVVSHCISTFACKNLLTDNLAASSTFRPDTPRLKIIPTDLLLCKEVAGLLHLLVWHSPGWCLYDHLLRTHYLIDANYLNYHPPMHPYPPDKDECPPARSANKSKKIPTPHYSVFSPSLFFLLFLPSPL